MSTDPRLFVDAPLNQGAALILERDQAHYLVSVMRRQPGDGVRVFNGRDGEWRAVLETSGKREARLALTDRLRDQTAGPDLTLYFAPVKKARTDFIVEKATELGARAIIPVITRRTNAERVRTDRLGALAREAAEQTERLDVPQIGEPLRLDALLDDWPPGRRLIFCDETGGAPMLEALLSERERGQSWSILIGPEGGFAPEERDRFKAAPGVLAVSLGPRILRADTAAAAALALWQAVMGDWE
ncbi:16S rRNA (uracil(1498)-N(3))-methyltransferase [Alkalicaulis satelles]|uniref:Ribosomal RNA small subunit methyltransferase E n=1 Tax=Alkalicaulis satelles TaxID=2609175 RepID=A0A5M6Z8R7_9PROT|nr:16S rRNA (uracil(1498)-N(3))-methyltransferase [Alkalicaulis satelles]KAA5801033.1 16S rRNA (uracil(1498)-N(3))-methyltransferase [Alkalicaulis satelles]